MHITKDFPKRLAVGLMSLVMTLTLLPALSAPAEAIAADDVNYADGPNWFSIDKGGGDAHERLSTLSMLLRYQKGNTAENAKNGIDAAFASHFDPHYSGDTLYIRLDYDIEVEFDVEEERGKLPPEDTPEWFSANWHCNLPVYGKKVLDLNGHTVKIWAKDGADCAFEIRNGATLTVVDSKGGGKMLTDTYIYGVGGGGVIDLFHVQQGGELILNAPDAEFECGRSKEQTYYGYAKDGIHKSDAGIIKVRGQSNGTVVKVANKGSLTVAGGTLRGRGYSSITKWGNNWAEYSNAGATPPQHCAAINATIGASVHIIDGEFIGKGCANALMINGGAYLTIESGTFDVSRVDRVAIPSASNRGEWVNDEYVWKIVNHSDSNYMDGSDGEIGILEQVLKALAEKYGDSVNIIQDGRIIAGSELDDNPDLNTYSSSKAVTIRPSGEMRWAGSLVRFKYGGGNESIDPVHQNSFKVTATYNEYYSDVAKKLLASDYRSQNEDLGKNDVEHYYEWKFDLYDYNDYCYYGHGHRYTNKTRRALYTGKTVSAEPQITVDLLDLTNFTREDWQELKTGSWMLGCEVTEVWKGEHTYELSYYDSTLLRVKDNVNILSTLMNSGVEPGIDIYHTDPTFNDAEGEASDTGLAQYLTCALDEETQIALDKVIREYEEEYLLSLSRQEIKTEYEIYHYGANRYSWWERYGRGLRGELTWDWPDEGDIGPVEVLTRLWVPEWNLSASASGANDAGAFRGASLMKWSQFFLYLPAMTLSDGTRVGFDQPVELPKGGSVTIEPNRTGWLADFKEKHSGTIKWQWYKSEILDLDSSERSFWRNVNDKIYVPYDTDDREEGSVTLTNSGTYRLVMTYTSDWDGKERNIVSVPIEVHGDDTAGLTATLSIVERDLSPVSITSYKATLKLEEGAWNQVESIRLRMMDTPAGIDRSPAVEIPVVKDQLTYTIDLTQFEGFKAFADGTSKEDPAGKYTLRATIKGKNGSGYNYTLYSNELAITLKKAADSYALVANGQYLGAGTTTPSEAKAQQVPLYLDSTKSTVTLDLAYSPQNATYDNDFLEKGSIQYEWFVWTDGELMNDSSMISLPNNGKSPGSAIKAEILRPGVGIIGCTKTAENAYGTTASKTIYFKVCVPVTEVEVTLPDYQNKIGEYYRDILPTFVAKTASGAAVPEEYDAFNFWYDDINERTEYAPSFANGNMTGVDRFRKKVEGNDLGRVTYTFQLNLTDDLSFPLRESYVNGDEVEYEVDLSAVQLSIKQADGTTTTMSAEEWGAMTDATFDTGFEQQKPSRANFTLSQDVFVKDPDAKYIGWLNITTTEPHVGDPVNEQITVYYNGVPQDKVYDCFKKADIMSGLYTEDGKPIIAPYSSQVNKADSTTVGAPYTDASGAKAEANKSFPYLTSAVYEAGTYFHDLQIQTNSNPCKDGYVYYFSPDVKVLLNGRLLDFGGVTYDRWGNSYLNLSYFYNVTVADYYKEITLDDITPKQGELPATDVTVKSTVSDKKLDVNVNDITWFVDANGNGQLDTGEEAMYRFEYKDGLRVKYDPASTLWYDGSFLPGVAYSVQLKLEPGDHTTRFTYPLTIHCGEETLTVYENDAPIVLSFDADNTIRTIALRVDSYMTDRRDPWQLFNASNSGYAVSVSRVQTHNFAMEDAEDIKSGDVMDNVMGYLDNTEDLQNDELEEGWYWLTLSAMKTSSDYQFSDDVKVRINDRSTGDFYYGNSSQGTSYQYRVNDIIAKKLGSQEVRILNPFYALGAAGNSGTTVSGTVTSFNSDTDDVTIQLIESGMSEAAYEAMVKGNSASYSIANVPAGTYTVKVMKKNHVTETVTITVSGADVTQNVTLSLLGDVNGDNVVTAADLSMLARHVAKNAVITDGHSLRCADVTRDGNVTASDLSMLARYIAKNISSFD